MTLAYASIRAIILSVAAVAFCMVTGAQSASAACPAVNQKIASAQDALRAAEPARDNTVADFERRLGLVANAYADAAAAETIRTTTAGGCADIQQVYNTMMTRAWADLLFATLKPSFDYYVADPSCKQISSLHTQAIFFEADETMFRSLISWYPIDDRVTVIRDHVDKLVGETASYLRFGLPPPEQAEDFARQDKFVWDTAREKATVDCTATVSDPNLPKPLVTAVFAPAT